MNLLVHACEQLNFFRLLHRDKITKCACLSSCLSNFCYVKIFFYYSWKLVVGKCLKLALT